MSLLTRRSAAPAAAGYSVIDDRLTISGELQTDGTVRIDGRVEGTMHRADTVIIGADGVLIGDVEAREVVVGGALHGNVSASGRVEVQSSATVQGDIRAAAVLLQEGGTVHGHVSVSAAGSESAVGADERRLDIRPAHVMPAVGQG